jgi:acetyl esterase/lipase
MDVAFGSDYYQKLDLYLPENDTVRNLPVLLYFHGGAWQHGYKEWNGFMAPAIVELPAIFVSASYRIVPEVKFPAPLDDAMAALDWVRRNIAEYGGDPGRIFAGGWSVGGTLASLITLRRELYAQYDLPDDIIKACFAASGGYRYKHDLPAPGDSGKTYGDLMYERPEDELLAEPLHYVTGNRRPFYISWASDDFAHVKQSSQDMVAALREVGCHVASEEFAGVDHYQFNLGHGDPDNKWVQTVREWMTGTPA